jgi:hypothetical protein
MNKSIKHYQPTLYFLYWNDIFQFSTNSKEKIRNYINDDMFKSAIYRIDSNIGEKNINQKTF